MAWAVPFAGNLVRDFQYGHFRYWNVPPRRDKIAYEHGTLVLVPKMSHQKKKFKNDKFGFFLIFALVIQHWMWVLLLDSLLECLTKVIQEWLRPGSLLKCLTEKKNYMFDTMRGATFEKWVIISVFLIKNLLLMKEFLHFKGQGDLWECQNWILDAFLSRKMVLESKKAWKIKKKQLLNNKKQGFGQGLG